jgi:hypothetical protein
VDLNALIDEIGVRLGDLVRNQSNNEQSIDDARTDLANLTAAVDRLTTVLGGALGITEPPEVEEEPTRRGSKKK